MSQNQEIIESKLCAYIDGELDADGRMEIEKHLDANPQHRRLLESLKATRDLIKWLPREPAPPELAETLNGQLERSVLLDFDERSLNRHILPRMFSAAAIVLLTAGLGAAVYFTLPKSQKNAMPYAMHTTESQSPMPDAAVPEAATEPAKPDDALVASAPMEKTTPPLMAMKAVVDRTPNPELDRLANDVSQNGAAIVAVATGAGPATNLQPPRLTSSNAIVMLVQANSTDQATRDVTTYLESQNIRWKPAPSTSTSGPAASQISGQLAESPHESLHDATSSREARRLMQNEPTTRPDLPGGAYAALTQSQINQANQSQLGLSQTTGLYVARMSRQQAIDLNNSVRQRKSQQSELKDLNGPSGYPYQGQNLKSQDLQASNGQNQIAQGQAAAPAVPPAVAAQMPQDRSQLSTFASGKPATQQAGGGFGGGGRFGGGFAGPQGSGFGAQGGAATEQATTLPTSQAATTESADSPVDVVIVMQPDTAAATEPSASLPQTEPATTQPATPQLRPQTLPAFH